MKMTEDFHKPREEAKKKAEGKASYLQKLITMIRDDDYELETC